MNYYPIHEAVETNNKDVVEILAKTLPEVRAVQVFIKFLIYFKKQFDAIHIAAQVSNPRILEYIIKINQAYVNVNDNEVLIGFFFHFSHLR